MAFPQIDTSGSGKVQTIWHEWTCHLQVLSRGTGSWGMGSPVTTPSKAGMYTGNSGPPTPEGLQYQNHNSAGSSLATTPAAQHAGNSEWDMFFADR